jgi:hypothetical protein
MAAMSDADEEAVTGLGTKVGALAVRGQRVVKLTTGIGAWTVTGVLMGNSCESGMGESAVAPVGYSYASSSLPSEDI